MEGKSHQLAAAIGDWARHQHGNVTRRQLLAQGFSGGMIDRRLRAGWLRPMYRGVYFAGQGPKPPLAYECAAVLACGKRTLLCGETAARIWQLPVEYDGQIQVTVVGRQIRGPKGLRVRQVDAVTRADVRLVEGVPIISPALTILEIAGTQSPSALAGALNEARVRRIVRDEQLRAVLAAHAKRGGARALARLLRSEEARLAIASQAEALCLELMRKHDLEPDESQARIGPYRVDFLFRAARLVVEVDGYRYHGTRHRFVRDRRRTAAIVARGYAVFPVSWLDLVERPVQTMRALRNALSRRRAALATA